MYLNCIQSKPALSNHFFAAENGKNKPIVRKKRQKPYILKLNDFLLYFLFVYPELIEELAGAT